MASKKVALLCTLLVGVGLVVAQSPGPQLQPRDDTRATQTGEPFGGALRPTAVTDADVAIAVQYNYADGYRAGESCPPNTLAGQDQGGNTWFFSDVQRCQSCPQGTCCGRVRSEDYPPSGVTITKPIGVISWRGIFLDQASSNGGVTKPPLFNIGFYPDLGGLPDRDHPYYVEPNVLCTQIDTGSNVLLSGGTIPAEVYVFTAVLTTPVNHPTGWFSIQGAAIETTRNIVHLWAPSTQGDSKLAEWFQNPLTAVQLNQYAIDLNYCFGEKRVGACCDDCHSSCIENKYEGDCLNEGGYFLYNQACSAVQPPCGQGIGACCHDDGSCVISTANACRPDICVPQVSYCRGDLNCSGGVDFGDINPFVLALSDPNAYRAQFPSCPWPQNADVNADGLVDFGDINPFVACLSNGGGPCAAHPPHGPCNTVAGPRAEGSVWAGRGTVCNDPNNPACCQILCDPNMVAEGEPVCANGYVDTYDAGCNSTPASFKTIACNTTICGNAGTYKTAGGQDTRDTDYYQVTVGSGPGVQFTVTVNAEFPVRVVVLGSGVCDPNNVAQSYYTINTAQGAKCTPTVITTRVLSIGTYWFAVMPQTVTGVLCGSDYTMQVTCDTTTGPCVISPPGNCINDPEPCAYGADTVNGGCNVTPNLFEDITFDPNGTAELCGTIWAKNGTRDLDWYRFTINSPKIVEVWWEAEFPGACGVVTGQDNGHPGAPLCTDGVWSCGAFDACSGLTLCNFNVLPAGYYWPIILIEDANGALFDGFPCGTQNRYHTRIRAYVPSCPNLITCTGGPPWGPLEGEPDCNNSYVDTFNGGCDNTASPHYLPVACDGHFCAKSGTWVNNGTPMMDTDWYSIVATGPTQYTVSVTAEFPLEFQLWKPGTGNSCSGAVMLEDYQVAACQNGPQDITLVHCLPAGTYWFRFSPQSAQIPMPCGASALNYSIWVSGCNTCTPCVFSCPSPNVPEGETCGTDTNGGCNDTPPKFTPANCNTTICGVTWASGGSRDTDWYRLAQGGTTPFHFNMTADTEVPILVIVVSGTVPGHPSCSDQAGFVETGIACQNGAGTNFVIPPSGTWPPGEYWIVVAPADASGNGIFENYPCGGGLNNYWLKILCQ